MDENKKPDAERAEGAPPRDTSETDTEAILSRRAFLIQGALASAGVAAGAAGCKRKPAAGAETPPPKPSPQPCLKVPATSSCLSKPPPRPDAGVRATVCLSTSVTPDKPMRPTVCLKVRAPRRPKPPRDRKPPDRPMVCLSKPRPRKG